MLNNTNQQDILISVIMCVYNTQTEYLHLAVDSILKQTHSNFELIIVDDCSKTDLFCDSIFCDKRIKIIRNRVNRGAAYARNQALKVAKGEFIAIMDSDDYSFPTRLEEQLNFMCQNPDVVVCGTWFQHFGAKNNSVERVIDDNEYYKCCLLFGNIPTLLNPSAMIRRQILEDYNIKYDERLRLGQDYGLWTELIKYGTITNYKKILVKYRIHENQVTNKNHISRQTLPYDKIVKIKQLDFLSDNFTEKEKDLFSLHVYDKRVKPVKYYHLLQKILLENTKKKYYDQEKLKTRIVEQWETKIRCINNPLLLLSIQIRIPKEFCHVASIKWKQFVNKILKKS